MRTLSILCLILSLACSNTNTQPEASSIELGPDRRTTNGEVARQNLNQQIESALRRYENPGQRSLVAPLLFDLLATRAQLFGTYDDFDLLDDLSAALDESQASSLRSRASFLGKTHDFDAAIELLSKASKLDGASTDDLLLRVARGEAVDSESSAQNYSFHLEEAARLASVAEYARADEHFLAALESYGDVSPFLFAHLQFQRGVMWAEKADRSDLAEALYREAVRRLPGHVAANVHLAEIEVERGDIEQAKARLERVIEFTGDPEPVGFLAELLLDEDSQRAASLTAQSRNRYDSLLSRYPLAFADHATEFYLGPIGNDVERAKELARRNLDNRKTPRAYLLALDAFEDEQNEQCRLITEAKTSQQTSEVLNQRIHASSCR